MDNPKAPDLTGRPRLNWQQAVEPKPISREEFDARVRRHGYVDRVTGRRIYDPDALGVKGDANA